MASVARLSVLFLVAIAVLHDGPRLAAAPFQDPQGVFFDVVEDESTWLPLGNIANEAQRGNIYRLDIRWEGSNFGTSKWKLQVRLDNVSNWRGIAGNFGTNTEPDFRIEADQNTAWDVVAGGQSATTKDEYSRGQKVRIVISSFDFAAVCTAVGSSTNYYIGETSRDIPKDEDHDGLPNVYENMFLYRLNPLDPDTNGNGTRDDAEDNDDLPIVNNTQGPTTPAGCRTNLGISGDGLTNWEEYRGFVIQRTHERTNWKVKDLFFASTLPDPSVFTLVTSQHPAKVHRIQLDEFSGITERLINENNQSHAGVTPQRALYIIAQNTPLRGVYGQTYNTSPPTGSVTGITAGPNGIVETSAEKDDIQLVPFGQNAGPNAPIIGTGPNGMTDTTAQGDDVQVLGPDFVSLTPNETSRCDIYVNQIDNDSSNAKGFQIGVSLTVAHECGHGTDIEHYEYTHKNPDHKKATIMAMNPAFLHPLPDSYDDVDIAQIRLHRKHQ